MWLLGTACVIISLTISVTCHNIKPHIVVIVADDLGWNDVGFHGSDEIPTPNIDALAYNGVILNSHYTQALGTPSRAAFLTGKYPIHTGMQHLNILETEPWGLGLGEILLPQHLKKHGYKTHAIGKWHLGLFKKEYTPTFRGFDTHFGFWQGHQDYYTHFVRATYTDEYGYDMRRDMDIDWTTEGLYSTEIFTSEAENIILGHDTTNPMFMYLAHLAPHTGNRDKPLQAPQEDIAKFSHIEDPERRIYAAMVSKLDESVGKVISALNKRKMLGNSIILLLSDNGAQTKGSVEVNYGSNYPLKGLKNSPWEGGMRCVAAVWSTLIESRQRVSYQLMHITDWLPTLYAAAGFDVSDLGSVDGVNMWNAISNNTPSPRVNFVYNIDDIENYAAVRSGNWKYVIGTTNNGMMDEWYGSIGGTQHHNYDTTRVLNSEAASAITDVTSSLVLEKIDNAIKSRVSTVRYEMPITPTLVNRSRNQAIINCLEVSSEDTLPCTPLKSACLFNIQKDTCERINLAITHKDILDDLEYYLQELRKTIVPARNRPSDPKANPALWNNLWTDWADGKRINENAVRVYWTPLLLYLVIGAVFIAVLLIIFFCSYYIQKHSEENDSSESSSLKNNIVKVTTDLKGKVFRTPNTSNVLDKTESQPLVSHTHIRVDYDATEKGKLLEETVLVSETFVDTTELDESMAEHSTKPVSFTKGGRQH